MNNFHKALSFAILFVFITSKTFCIPNKEAKLYLASLFIIKQKDSLTKKEYFKLKKLYDKGDFINSLENAYKLLNSNKNSKEIKYLTLTNILIGDIFIKTQKNSKALEYFK